MTAWLAGGRSQKEKTTQTSAGAPANILFPSIAT